MPAKIKNNCCRKQCFQNGTYTFSDMCNKFAFTKIIEIKLGPGNTIQFSDNGIVTYLFTNPYQHWYKVYVCLYVSRTTVMGIN